MIPISTKNRLIELKFSSNKLGKICLVCDQKIVQVKVKNMFLGGKNISHNLTSLAKMYC